MASDKHGQAERNNIVEANLKLVYKAVNRYKGWLRFVSGIEKDDLFSIGSIGLIQAAELYDSSKGSLSFSNYAYRRICTNINRFINSYNPTIAYPRRAREVYNKLYKYNLLEKPISEIILATSMSISDIEMALDFHNCKVISFQTVINTDNLGNEITLENFAPSFSDFTSQLILDEILTKLNDKQKVIFYYYYFKQMSQSEISNLVKMTQPHVSRNLKKIKLIMEDFVLDKKVV